MATKREPSDPLAPVTMTGNDPGTATGDDDDPTRGGALPDPNDDSPRGRFNRGELTAAELAAELDAEADG